MSEWRTIDSRPTSENTSFLVMIPGNDMCESLAVQVSNFEGSMYADCRDGIIDWEDRIVDAMYWMELPEPPTTISKAEKV